MGALSCRQDDWQGTVYKLKGCPAIASITGGPIGKAHVAYLPDRRVDIYARRLQIQERMTVQITDTLNDVLQPKGVAVVIEASHQCMSTRGLHKVGAAMVTSRMRGAFCSDRSTRREFLVMIGRTGAGPLSNT